MKKFLLFFVFLLVIAGGVALMRMQRYEPVVNIPDGSNEEIVYKPDPLNATYVVEGVSFNLVSGHGEVEFEPGMAVKNELSVFGEPKYGDFDGDGDTDAAVWLVGEPGGTGVFYYAALVMNNGTTSTPTNTLFLGDRIAPQSLDIAEDGRAVYNYAVRGPNEPMAAEPTVGKSLIINYDKSTREIGELAPNFEGEADPNVMKLNMKKWEWQYTNYNDDTKITPKDPKKFTLTFKDDGTFSASTDCNGVGGSYTTGTDKKLTFGQMLGTLMYCEGSQEGDFKKVLENTGSYMFTSKGELVLLLKFDSGSAVFR